MITKRRFNFNPGKEELVPEIKGEGAKMSGKRKKKNRTADKKKITVAALICALISAGMVIYMVTVAVIHRQKENEYEALRAALQTGGDTAAAEREVIVIEDVPARGDESTAEETSAQQEETVAVPLRAPERLIDWDLLHETNEDIYAWIVIPDSSIDYPVLQHPSDDTYYLNYNLDGSRGYPGCIYTERANSKDFSDFQTVLYGHNMRNGTMFAGLHNWEDASYFDSHEFLYIYTPEESFVYRIFAAYRYSDAHLIYAFDYSTEEGRDAFLKAAYDAAHSGDSTDHYRDGVEPDDTDHIITLSTCVGGQSDRRYLVQAVRR